MKIRLKKALACAAAALALLAMPQHPAANATANAAAGAAAAVSAGSSIAVPAGAGSFSVDITRSGAGGAFAAIGYDVSYDRGALSLTGYTFNPAFAGAREVYETADSGGTVTHISYVGDANASDAGPDGTVAATLGFAIRADAAAAIDTRIKVGNVRLSRVYPASSGGFRTEVEAVAGDFEIRVTRAAGGGAADPEQPGGGGDAPGGGSGGTPSGGGTPGGGSSDGGGEPPASDPGGSGGEPAGDSGDGGAQSGSAPPSAAQSIAGSAEFTFYDPANPLGGGSTVENPFKDVSPGDWFYDDVAYVYINGLFRGTADDAFSPNADVTRGMMITVAGRMHGIDGALISGAGFDDVAPGAYYAPYAQWGRDNGLVLGVGGNRYEPERDIKRQELAAVFKRYADFVGAALPETRGDAEFADEAAIHGYAKEAVHELYRAGIINGRGGGVVDPEAPATRAETAAMFRRFALAIGWAAG
jgi:hypothetical protein